MDLHRVDPLYVSVLELSAFARGEALAGPTRAQRLTGRSAQGSRRMIRPRPRQLLTLRACWTERTLASENLRAASIIGVSVLE